MCRAFLYTFLGTFVASLILLHAPIVTFDEGCVVRTYEDVVETTDVAGVNESIPKRMPIVFVGDIMLGRGVESRMIEFGTEYPFAGTGSLFASSSLAVANFEGVVSPKHVHAPSMTFQFSIRPEYLIALAETGFDVLSLANNHSYDYGRDAFLHTRALCAEFMIVCGGVPGTIDATSTHIANINGTRIGFFFAETVTAALDEDVARMRIAQLASLSDIQIVYIHWGDEYMLTHNAYQERLAKLFIDAGADAVIGHHPHVVQDVGMYNGKPIFYSLGNFIFDQYFSDDVQEHTAVTLDIESDHVVYTVIPYTSINTRAQPHPMESARAAEFFNRIFSSVRSRDEFDAAAGSITVAR